VLKKVKARAGLLLKAKIEAIWLPCKWEMVTFVNGGGEIGHFQQKKYAAKAKPPPHCFEEKKICCTGTCPSRRWFKSPGAVVVS